MNRLVCVGVVVKDLVFRVPRIPPVAQKLTARSLDTRFGGMAATAAAAAAALGGDVEFWSRVGDDEAGREAERALRSRGVAAMLKVTPGASSPTSAVIVDDAGERMLAVYPGELDADAGWLPTARVAGAGAVHADFRWPEGARALYRAARELGIPRVLDADAGGADALRELMALADHVIFSERGLADVAGDLPSDQALRRVAGDGERIVAVTLGERGSLFLQGGQFREFAAPRVVARDTNGAGDVFHGAYALALARGLPWWQAAQYATAAASLKCTREHGWDRLPDHGEVMAFMGDQAVDPGAARDAEAGKARSRPQ